MSISGSAFENSWRVFSEQSKNQQFRASSDLGMSYASSAYNRSNYNYSTSDIIKTVYTRIALDASMVEFKHLKINEKGEQRPIKSQLAERLSFDANIDQSGRSFIYDAIWSLLDEGYVAIVPTHTSRNPKDSDSYDILSLRVGKILEWYPKHVRVECWNEDVGRMESVLCEKRSVAIVESPLMTMLSKNNKTLTLIEQKVKMMSQFDESYSTGKINGFIQLPYQTSTTKLNERAEKRRQQIEKEMSSNKYGLVMLDKNEEYISTGGSITNNFLEDIMKLKQDYLDGIGLTENIIKGTASTNEHNLYYHRVVEPCLYALVDSINKAFISKTARTQGHVIRFFRDPFKLMPIEQLATAADLFSRNAIMYPNEIRDIIGKPPHPDPLANKLFNRNISDANQFGGAMTPGQTYPGAMPHPNYSVGNQNEQQPEEITIYPDGNGGWTDENGNPVDENGYPLE